MSDSNAIYDCVSHLFMCRSTLMVLIVGGITVIVIICSVAESDSTNNQQSSPPTKVKPHDSTSNYSGARPFKTTDFGLTQQIVSDIRDLARRNSRYIPAPKYLQKLISENTTYGDELCTLKSAGIMHYIVRSGKYTIERSIKVSWENREKLARPSDFLIATLELANVRNALIHGGRVEKWPEDPIPVITRNAEILVEACKFVAEENVDSQVTPTANLDLVLAENHIKPGNRVKHVLLGEGTIVDVLPKTFSVDFDNSTRKAFFFFFSKKFFTAI